MVPITILTVLYLGEHNAYNQPSWKDLKKPSIDSPFSDGREHHLHNWPYHSGPHPLPSFFFWPRYWNTFTQPGILWVEYFDPVYIVLPPTFRYCRCSFKVSKILISPPTSQQSRWSCTPMVSWTQLLVKERWASTPILSMVRLFLIHWIDIFRSH